MYAEAGLEATYVETGQFWARKCLMVRTALGRGSRDCGGLGQDRSAVDTPSLCQGYAYLEARKILLPPAKKGGIQDFSENSI